MKVHRIRDFALILTAAALMLGTSLYAYSAGSVAPHRVVNEIVTAP